MGIIIKLLLLISLKLPLNSAQNDTCSNWTEPCEEETIASFLAKESRLLAKLLTGYRPEIPPLYTRDRFEDISHPNRLNIIVVSGKLITMNEPRQTINLLVEWVMTWSDFRLQWDPDEFDGIEMLAVNRALLWLPDCMPQDMTSMTQLYTSYLQNAIIYPNGTLMLRMSASFGQICRLNIAYFPFDMQYCNITISSSNYIHSELSLTGSLGPEIDPLTFGNAAWSVDNFTVKEEVYLNEIDGREYSRVIYTIAMRRSSVYYVILIIIPSVIITSLTVFGMFWSEITERSYSEKVTLGFSSFLAQTVILQITSQSIPATSNIPGLSIYILTNLLILFTSIVVVHTTASSLNCEIRKKKQVQLALSKKPWLRILGLAWTKLHFLYTWIFMILVMTNFLILMLRRQ